MSTIGFNQESYGHFAANAEGSASGKIMGRVITNMEAAFESFKALSTSAYNNFLKSAPVAIAKDVYKAAAKATQAFALALKDMDIPAIQKRTRAPVRAGPGSRP